MLCIDEKEDSTSKHVSPFEVLGFTKRRVHSKNFDVLVQVQTDYVNQCCSEKPSSKVADFLCLCSLFNDALSAIQTIASNGRAISE